MIYNIGNKPETAKLLQQTMPPNTKDFGWFLATVEEAISKNCRWNSISTMETAHTGKC